MEIKAVCSGDRQRIQYQQSIEFLRSQHQELVGNLHEEIERLKRKNRGLSPIGTRLSTFCEDC